MREWFIISLLIGFSLGSIAGDKIDTQNLMKSCEYGEEIVPDCGNLGCRPLCEGNSETNYKNPCSFYGSSLILAEGGQSYCSTCLNDEECSGRGCNRETGTCNTPSVQPTNSDPVNCNPLSNGGFECNYSAKKD